MRLLSAVRDFVAVLAVVALYLPAVLLGLLAGPLQGILDRRSLVARSRPRRQQPFGVGRDERALPDGAGQMHTGVGPR
jgi:hypothetical protein